MSEHKPDKRAGDRRQSDDVSYEGDERRKAERRTPTPPPKPAG